jgi:WD40 repeat protein
MTRQENKVSYIAPLAVEKLKVIHTLSGHTGYIYGVAISPDGQTLVSGGADKTIKVWSLSTGKELYTLASHTNGVYVIAISPDGQTLVSGSWDMTIKVWGI